MNTSEGISAGTRKDAPARTGPIAYVLQEFPLLTETFVYREVLALRHRGGPVAAFAFRKPRADSLSAASRPLVEDSHYVLPLVWHRFLANHLFFFLTRPLRYTGTLLVLLMKGGGGLKDRALAFCHFGGAVHLARTMQRLRVWHIHAHFTINAATMAMVISRLLNVPYSFTAHNLCFTRRFLLKEKIRGARFIVAISEFTRRFLIDQVSREGTADKIHVVHCGLSPEDFSPADPRPKNEVPLLVFVGQLAERKGAHILVEASRILRNRDVPFRCLIIGDGPQRARIEEQVARYDMKDRVELKGARFQEELKSILLEADIFVLPCVTAKDGDRDGVPVALMEAMAMELPAVSTRISGIPELIEDGQSGLLVGEGDPEGLADALQRLIEDRDLRARLGKNGRCKVVEAFHIDKNIDRLVELFHRYRA
jgi:glycosyltransferase involved in cell wall biosynthesis